MSGWEPSDAFGKLQKAAENAKERAPLATTRAKLGAKWAAWVDSARWYDAYVEEHGFEYRRERYDMWAEREGDALPGMIFRDGERRDALIWHGPPAVEFGNWHSGASKNPQMFGYLAIRHGLGLPHVVLNARANDATPPAGSFLYADKGDYTSLTENFRGSGTSSPMDNVRLKVTPLDMGEGASRYFQAHCGYGQEDDARAFLNDPATARLIIDLVALFDVEVTRDWIFVYGYSLPLSHPHEDARWPWSFSIASRVLDQAQAWGRRRGITVVEEWPSFYTEERVSWPAWVTSLPKPSPGVSAFWG